MSDPLLTIGIIFRDDIRSIQRCLDALQPLREAISCELIMADTGSTDGSRQVAEQYADLLFDFPWVNDFAAARNAVMDRASGKWYFSVDTDEYLDPKFSQLVKYLNMADSKKWSRKPTVFMLQIRNYAERLMGTHYSDFMAMRILRMSTGIRYTGTIHEHWEGNDNAQLVSYNLTNVLLHHDGYIDLGKKAARNMPLLRKKAEELPEDLITWMQLMESGPAEPDHKEMVRKSVALIKQKVRGWDVAGAAVISVALQFAFSGEFPERWDWLQMAEELYPNSPYVTLDAAYYAATESWNNSKFESCIRWGERYFETWEQYQAGKIDPDLLRLTTLRMASPYWEQTMRAVLGCAYIHMHRTEDALRMAQAIDFGQLDEMHAQMALTLLKRIHVKSSADTTPLICAFWSQYIKQEPEKAKQREEWLIKDSASLFLRKTWDEEAQSEGFCRHGGTLFFPLEGDCILGDSAALCVEQNPQKLEEIFSRQESWFILPPWPLLCALAHGMRFPLPGKTVDIETMNQFAKHLALEKKAMISLACRVTAQGDCYLVYWAKSLAVTAVQAYNWKQTGNGMELARNFAKVEKKFLATYYAPEILAKGNLSLLPAIHRFGFYCAQAFDALDVGDAAGYVRLLREGLAVCEGVKDMVEFLLNNTPELINPSDEMRAIAEQIRAVLSKFAPDDPTVEALKQSEAYQKVAYLIEEIDTSTMSSLS